MSALDDFIAKLEAFRGHSRGDFLSRPELHDLAERYLHLAMECVLDLAHQIIAIRGLRVPSDYKDAIESLGEAGLLERDLADRLKSWAGYRNVLVHLYLSIDHGIAYDAIHRDLDDLKALARVVAAL